MLEGYEAKVEYDLVGGGTDILGPRRGGMHPSSSSKMWREGRLPAEFAFTDNQPRIQRFAMLKKICDGQGDIVLG